MWTAALVCCLGVSGARADWLADQAKPDGSYSTATDIATVTQATAETARTLRALGRGTEANFADVRVTADPYDGTELLARRVVAGVALSAPAAPLIAQLLTYQNADGGFGEAAGYDSNPLDTAYALEALAAANMVGGPVNGAVNYLRVQQTLTGGWSGAGGSADPYTSALAARALSFYRTQIPAIAPTVNTALNYLLGARRADGLWGEDFVSAQALLTLAISASDPAPLAVSASALRAAQRADGSWAQDVYSTALALRALRVFDTRGGSTASTGSVSGYVLSAGTTEPLQGATVAAAGRTVQTNAEGYFSLAGLPAGDQTLLASKAGYESTSVVAQVRASQLGNAGSILLAQSTSGAVVRGKVFDAGTRQGLAGTQVSFSGSANYSVVSGADGSFELPGITPGSYSLVFHKSGYTDVSGTLTAPAGSLTDVQQGLTLSGAAQDDTPAPIAGRVIDAASGQPIAGAQLALAGGATIVSGTDGAFSFAGVARGSHELVASAGGYQARTFSFTFAPGPAGDLGALQLFAANGGASPTTLTLIGRVIDAVDNHALPGAVVNVTETGESVTADSEGRFTVSGLTTLAFNVSISAADHEPRSFGATASGYGQVSGTFALPPLGGDDTATTSILRGTVVDSLTGEPIADARVDIAGTTAGATSGTDGSFEIAGIEPLGFEVTASALRYTTRSYQLDLTQRGTYNVSVQLTPEQDAGSDRVQILSFNAVEGSIGANSLQHFNARLANLTTGEENLLVLADVLDASGNLLATVSPYAPGTTVPAAQVLLPAGGTLELTLAWNTAQFAPGTYRVVLRVVEPGSVARELPSGVVLTRAESQSNIAATRTFLGQVAPNPPLTQAGTTFPVALNALVINSGNVTLTGTPFTLTVTNPANGQVLTTAHAAVASLAPGSNQLLDFGSWVPTVSGDLAISVRADDAAIGGLLAGTLYVGDKATGQFTVNRSVVPLGTQTVRANIALQGVDVRTGTSTDPLFAAVKESVRKGGLFVGPQVRTWNQTNRCLGCHIQSQSFLGMASSMDKADISRADVQYLFNDIMGSLQPGGSILPSHSEAPLTQTVLHIWALNSWPEPRQIFRTQYRGAAYAMSRRSVSGNQVFWPSDHCSVWLCNNDGPTMTAVMGIANVVRTADALGSETVNDYVFEDTGVDFQIRDMLGVQKGPDGQIWYLDSPGQLYARDMTTGVNRLVAANLGAPPIGLAITADGAAYVTAPNLVTRIAADGTRTVIQWPGIQSLWDIALGPDGALYVSDVNRIWRIAPDHQVTTYATSGLINRPLGLTFDPAGNLFLANYNAWNILKVTPTGQVTVFADGLPFQPTWLKRAGDGFLYAMTQRYNNAASLGAGVFRIDTQGYIERITMFDSANQYGYNALAIIDGEVYTNHGANHHLYRLRVIPQETSQIPAMRAALVGAARWALARHTDNAPGNDIQAMRLTILAEARTVITDPALLASVDTAINTIATLLRSRQAANGGWPYAVGRVNSDPYATAAVGLALEYTNPSADDPAIRNSISYLLNSQLADGSWAFQDGVFTTKLGPASFVMAYMPKALERLGGIDAGLKLTLPASAQLSAPVPAPTAQSTAADGSKSYEWSLLGVTSAGRNVTFDLTLADLGYGEERAVANSAQLEFANSFSGETLRTDLEIPSVRAVSELGLAVSTALSSYPANTDVPITSVVSNVGPVAAAGTVHLVIRAADGTAVADLGTVPFATLASGASTSLPGTWNTATLLRGGYEVYAQLFNAAGQLVDERAAPFAIVAPPATLSASIAADKPDYRAWDTVNLANRVRNVSANAVQPASRATLTVHTPAGAVLYSQQFELNSLAPGARTDLPASIGLADAASGAYPAELVVRDAFSGELLTSATGQFQVTRIDAQALTGSVSVGSTRVPQGQSNLCTDTVTNLSQSALAGVSLTRSVVNVDTSAVIDSGVSGADLGSRETRSLLRSVPTTALPSGVYACVLSASYQGVTRQLGSAAFEVVAPPIRIDASLTTGTRGRLLVLLDEASSWPCTRIKDIELWAPFRHSLPANARVEVALYDANDQRIDVESVTLAQFRGTVNARRGSRPDLALTGASRDGVTVQLSSSSAMGAGYRVVATATATDMAPIVVESNVMGESCGWRAGHGAHFGDFRCSGGHGYPNGGLPPPQASTPTLQQQRTFLENLLDEAGWSYTIVTDDEAFESELRTGGYSQYALFAEHEKLDEVTQKELREAVFRGEGLLDAGQHDRRHNAFDEAVGIKPDGRESHARNVSFEASWLPAATTGITATAEPLRIRLRGATPIARFERSYGYDSVAATQYQYGLGKSVYVGYDLLVEATISGANGAHAALLRNALVQTSPAQLSTRTGAVIPIVLNVHNRGQATPAVATLPMPAGVVLIDPGTAELIPDGVRWSFSLAEDEQRSFTVYLRSPDASGATRFEALVQSGVAPNLLEQARPPLTVSTLARSTLAEARALAASNGQCSKVRLWLELANFWLGRGNDFLALTSLLKAADEAMDLHDVAQATQLRLMIDDVIVTVEMEIG